VLSAAKRVAAMARTGRLNPPLRIVGDEICNVAPVPKLPGYLSNSRGFGLQWWLAFQSMAQILACWGEAGGRALMANLNLSMILDGLQDEQALERFWILVGNADIMQVSANLDAANTVRGHSMSTSDMRVMPPEKIRQLPLGQALVIYRTAPAMLVDLKPWTARADGEDIAEGIRRIRALRMGAPAVEVQPAQILPASGQWTGR
jgi:type IV secretion system protein VirD4